MAQFIYEAKSSGQKTVRGEIDARSRQAAVLELGKMGYFPLNISSKGSECEIIKLGLTDLSNLFRQISDLLSSGVSLPVALKMVADQTRHSQLKKNLDALTRDVQQGKSLSVAMGAQGKTFTAFYVKLVQAGEAGGMLPKTLERLADLTEKEEDTRAQIRAAMAYPAFIFFVGILTVTFLLTIIVPRIAVMFSDLRENLPLPTKILMALSDGSKYILLFIIIAAPLFYSFLRKDQTRLRFRNAWDRLSLKIPYFKSWVMNHEIGQYARTLGLLIQSGVPLPQSIAVSFHTVRHSTFKDKLRFVESEVRQGSSLSQCLKKSEMFPDSLCNLTAVAEQGGRLGESLVKISDTIDRQAQRELKVMVSLLEPAMILVIGAILGVVVLSIMLPIFDINAFLR